LGHTLKKNASGGDEHISLQVLAPRAQDASGGIYSSQPPGVPQVDQALQVTPPESEYKQQ
jgi:hypothetical protein